MAETRSVEAVRAQAAGFLARGDAGSAARLYAQILHQLPYDPGARAGLRAVVQRQKGGEPTTLVTNLLAKLEAIPGLDRNAALGWQYTDQLEAAFIDPSLVIDPPVRISMPTSVDAAALPPIPEGLPAAEVLRGLARHTDVTERWHALRSLINQRDLTLLGDSFVGAAEPERRRQRAETLAGSGFTVVILGAGCTGLALANALKMGLGRRVTVLVIEARAEQPGIKRPYSRNWLTNIRTQGWESLFDPMVVRLLNGLGRDGYMGVPVNAFETLMLLSCKAKGVRFWFEADPDLAFLQDSATHLVVDATGGRLSAPVPADIPPRPPVPVDAVPHYGTGHSSHGITNTQDAPARSYPLSPFGRVYRPMKDGGPIAVGMIKLTGIPVGVYRALLPQVRKDNADGHIYLWPGTLDQAINSALALICLQRPAFEALAERVTAPTPLSAFLAAGGPAIPELDRRFVRLLDAIAHKARADAPIGIEPPFVFAPTYRPLDQAVGTFMGKPLLAVGDSLYTGNPKVGNGLAGHLNFVRTVHDLLLISHAGERSIKDAAA